MNKIKDDPLLAKKSLFRIDEVASYFQVDDATIRLWIDHGHLVSQKDNGLTKISFESMERCRFRIHFVKTLPKKEYLRPDEIAEYFRLSVKTIYNWIDEGKIEAVNIGQGNTVRIKRSIVKQMIRSKDK